MKNAEPAILLNTILVMSTLTFLQMYSQDDIEMLFDIHKQNLIAQGFESEEIDTVIQQVQTAIEVFQKAIESKKE